jgi:hypothetical protein
MDDSLGYPSGSGRLDQLAIESKTHPIKVGTGFGQKVGLD